MYNNAYTSYIHANITRYVQPDFTGRETHTFTVRVIEGFIFTESCIRARRLRHATTVGISKCLCLGCRSWDRGTTHVFL